MHSKFRPNVAAVIVNSQKKVLVCQRAENGYWQFPQGGVDENEDNISALFREMHEEIGTTKLRAISRSKNQYSYKWPSNKMKRDEYVGQTQRYYLLQFLGSDEDIKIDKREFVAFQWIAFDDVIEAVEPVRRNTYEKVLEEFRPLLDI